MGIIQNLSDKFYMTIGKTDKIYPVTVEKYRVQGKTIVFDEIDKGRTLVQEDGTKKFDLLNEPHAEGLVKYEDFQDTTGSDNFVSLCMITRDEFVPLNKKFDTSVSSYIGEEEREQYDISHDSLEYVLGVSTYLNWAEQSFQDSAKIVETSDDKWYEQPKIQAAMLFVGAGLFFVLASVAQGELYYKDVAQKLGQNTEALRTLQEGLANNIQGGGN
jgi:hypothetical protein